MELKGIKELKELVDLGLSVASIVDQAKADGKWGLEDAALLFQLLPKVGPAFDSVGEIPSELSDLSSEEAAELISHVMANLVLTDEKARLVLEKSLKAAGALWDLVKAIK